MGWPPPKKAFYLYTIITKEMSLKQHNVGLKMFNHFLTFMEAINTETPCVHQRKKKLRRLIVIT